MKYLLDSETISDLSNRKSSAYTNLNAKLRSMNDDDIIYVSVITLYELEYGYANADDSIREIIREKNNSVVDQFTILPLNKEGSIIFGKLKAIFVNDKKLNKKSAKRHNVDIILACAAIFEKCVLVSKDKIFPELKRLYPEFQCESWA